jgi:hypothetical protein
VLATAIVVAAAVGAVARGAGVTGTAAPAADPAGVAAMLRAADAALHPIQEGILRVRSTVTQEGADPAVSMADVYVQGRDRVLCIFRDGPLAARRILTVGERAWLLVPGSARAIPVSAGQRLLGGASIADVARLRFDLDFDAVPRAADEQVGDTPCAVFDLRARGRTSPYATATLWIGRADGLPRRSLLFLASGKPAKEVLFTHYRRGPAGPVLARLRILHRLPTEQGMETDLELMTIEAEAIDPDVFTPDGARRLS